MKYEYKTLYNYLLDNYSKEKADKIIIGISNPAKYPWIIDDLKVVQKNLSLSKTSYNTEEFLKLSQIIEDELINTILICQDSKCKPLKFVNFKVNKTYK